MIVRFRAARGDQRGLKVTDKYSGSHEIRQHDEVLKITTDRNFGRAGQLPQTD